MRSSKRGIGDNLEEEAVKKLGPGFELTANSGATWSDGDIRHSYLVGECKKKGKMKGFSAPASELNKLIKQADQQLKQWFYIQENADGRQMILVELDTFVEMTEEWRERHGRRM